MKTNYFIVILFLFLFTSTLLSNNNLHNIDVTKSISTKNGLSSNNINKLFFDKKGFLWISTSKGFNKFDGYKIKKFLKDIDKNSLDADHIDDFLIHSSGKIWILANSLIQYNPITDTFKRFNTLPKTYSNKIYELKNGDILVSQPTFGFHIISSKDAEIKKSFEFKKGSFKDLEITEIAQNNDKKLWFSTNWGVFTFDLVKEEFKSFNLFKKVTSLNTSTIKHIMIDTKQRVWLSTANGLILYDIKDKTIKHFTASSKIGSLPTNKITLSYEDKKGNIWIGTDKEGVVKYLKKDKFLSYSEGLPMAGVSDITEDNNGFLWLSLYKYGLYKLNLKKKLFFHYKKNEDINKLNFDNLSDLHEDKDKNIWLASDGGGLFNYIPKSKKFISYLHDKNNKNSLSSNSILSINETDDGLLWLGTWEGGLNSFSKKDNKFKTYKSNEYENLLGNSIFYIHKDKKNNLWLSVWGKGLHHFNTKTKEFTNFNNSKNQSAFNVKDKHINFIYETKDNVMYLGGHNGLHRIKSDTLTKVFAGMDIDFYDVYEDNKYNLWFATSGGLLKYNIKTKDLKIYNKKDGFASNYIFTIELYKDDVFILGSDNGIIKFDAKTLEVTNYDKSDGIQDEKFNKLSSLKASDNTFYFGGMKGLNVFKNLEKKEHESFPNIEIVNLDILQKKVEVSKNGILKKDISYLKNITIPYDKRDMTFELSILNFDHISKHKFKYKLEGYDSNWKETNTKNRYIRYTNLAPNTYTLHYQGSSDGKTWNTKIKTLEILIKNPWWLKINYLILFALIFLYTAYVYIRYKRNIIIKNEKNLQKEVFLKSKDLNKALKKIKEAKDTLEDRVERRTKDLKNEIKKKEKIEKKLLYTISHDILTASTNRFWLKDKLLKLLEKVKKDSNLKFALININGNKFKSINDRYGHNIGDEVLKLFSKRINKILLEGMSLSRKSGDEFALLIEDSQGFDDIKFFLQKLIYSIDEAYIINDLKIFYNVSIGIVLVNKEYDDIEVLLNDADIALSYAKKRKEVASKYQFFDLEMRNKVQEKKELLEDLKRALKNDEFYMVYQPIVDAKTLKIDSLEALIRWDYKKRFVGPDTFIPMAEKHGLINEIGLWIIKVVIKQLRTWLDMYAIPNLKVAINLSANQLSQINLLKEITSSLIEYKIDSSMIKFEVTETAFMNDVSQSKKVLEDISKKGIELALDDFGTGYSSLSYLHNFPIDYLKIDKSFINQIEVDFQALEITKSVISLAKSLNIKIIAEGVENEAQLKILQDLDCEYIQGYHIDKPLLSDKVQEKWF